MMFTAGGGEPGWTPPAAPITCDDEAAEHAEHEPEHDAAGAVHDGHGGSPSDRVALGAGAGGGSVEVSSAGGGRWTRAR